MKLPKNFHLLEVDAAFVEINYESHSGQSYPTCAITNVYALGKFLKVVYFVGFVVPDMWMRFLSGLRDG